MAIADRWMCASGAPGRSDSDRIARPSRVPLGKPAVVSMDPGDLTTAAACAPRAELAVCVLGVRPGLSRRLVDVDLFTTHGL
jgi:hypothetical protein